MKGIILSGGTGTRLFPMTKYYNKHLLPVYLHDEVKPLIDFAVDSLVELDIKDITVILGDNHFEDIVAYLKDGSEHHVRFSYVYQEEPLGIPHAIFCARKFFEHSADFIAYLGDNVFEHGISMIDTKGEAGVILAKPENNNRFGVPIIENNEILGFKEKPSVACNPYALTGAYYFKTKFFLGNYPNLKMSPRKEYEIVDLLTLSAQNKTLVANFYDGWWVDAGTPEAILELCNRLNSQEEKEK